MTDIEYKNRAKPVKIVGASEDGTESLFADVENIDSKRRLLVAAALSLSLDDITSALLVIDYEHHEVHEGSAYFQNDFFGLQNNINADFLIISPTTADKFAHMLFNITTTAEVHCELYEDVVVSANGTARNVFNRHRGSAKTAETLIYRDPTITSLGTKLQEFQVGAGLNGQSSHGAGSSLLRSEILLKPSGAKYLFRITSAQNGNDVSTLIDWYEHTDL